MRTTVRLLLLVLAVLLATGCIFAGKRGRGTNLPPSTDRGGPWTQGEPTSPSAVEQPER